ncbi:MAG: hypothetical protein KAT78_01075 [Flavobacteriaceae bacterium]|nr:hypothetical protein [Flavobacteriaceae bacterium]
MKQIIILFILISQQLVFSQVENNKNPILVDKFRFNAGVYFPTETLKIGANGDSPNIDFDFNEAFKLDNYETTFFFNFFWRFSKKWMLSTEYFGVSDSKKLELEEDVHWNEYTFKKGSNVEADYGLDIYRIFAGRVISRGAKHEFVGGLGIHAMNINAFIKGEAFINEEDFEFKKSAISSTIPFPNLALWYIYAPTSKLSLMGRLDWFGITVGEYSGSLWNIGPSINYQIFKNIGIGASYRYFKASAKVNKPDWDGRFSVTYKGPLISISGNF